MCDNDYDMIEVDGDLDQYHVLVLRHQSLMFSYGDFKLLFYLHLFYVAGNQGKRSDSKPTKTDQIPPHLHRASSKRIMNHAQDDHNQTVSNEKIKRTKVDKNQVDVGKEQHNTKQSQEGKRKRQRRRGGRDRKPKRQ